jgi:hypothetical protein
MSMPGPAIGPVIVIAFHLCAGARDHLRVDVAADDVCRAVLRECGRQRAIAAADIEAASAAYLAG